MKFLSNPSQSMLSKLIALALLVTISACANKNSSETDPSADSSTVQTQGVDDGDVTVSDGDAQNLSGAESGMHDAQSGMMSEADLLKQRSFYFEYDSFRVNAEAKKAILAQGKYLSKASIARVRVEGNTDERGTREYNLALGEKRANAVRDLLMSAGAQSKQIEVITYGEERPKASGSTETAYRQNRRVDIQYTVGQP